MNWILGLIGALIGAAMSRSLGFGLLVGFCVGHLLGSVAALKARVGRSENELALLRLRTTESLARAADAAVQTRAATSGEAAPADAEFVSSSELASTSEGSAFEAQSSITDAHSPSELENASSVRESVDAQQDLALSAMAVGAAHSPSTAATDANAAASASYARVDPIAAGKRSTTVGREPPKPVWDARVTAVLRRWFTEGNVPVKVGVLVLFVGVAAALRYAAAEGYLRMPIEVRLAVIGAAALAGLAWGWRERERKPAFGLSVQGGAIGVLLLDVFAAYGLYHLIPSQMAFALVIVLVAGAALLAVLQNAVALAALGFLGGYLAPVLIQTGSNNHVALFSWFAVLNAAVFWISWRRSWRVLNLIGFVFTFGVGTVWGARFYRPELFASVEPFLILFFAFYLVIGLLYVLRQSQHRRPWVDGTLVFGTPLLAFPLQAALLKDQPTHMPLAFSALVVAVIYVGMMVWLRRRRDERLLTQAYGALAMGFATLAIPLAFSASTTASVWALEGAAAAWLGIRQNRVFPWLAGLALQLLAAGAYVISQIDFAPHLAPSLLLLNPTWLGAAIIAIAGFILSLVHDRLRPRFQLPRLLFAWATIWWLVAAVTQLDLAEQMAIGERRFWMLYLAATIGLAAVLRLRLPWPRLRWLVATGAVLSLLSPFGLNNRGGGPLAMSMLPAWAAYAAALAWALWRRRAAIDGSNSDDDGRAIVVSHLAALWTLVLVCTLQGQHLADVWRLANGWQFAMLTVPLAVVTFGLWESPTLFAWPRAEAFARYRFGWFAPSSALLAFAFVSGLLIEGSTMPLAFVPLLNPLELLLIGILALLVALCSGSLLWLRKLLPYAGFALVTSFTLRAVHFLHGEPWSPAIFDSGVTQMALTVVWSLLGVGAWIVGSRRADRRLWMGGAVLMGIVLLKLIAVDRQYMGDVPGIASFLAVGLLLMGVGYLAPSPPRQLADGQASAAPDPQTSGTES